MKIRRTDEKPMTIHQKEKTMIHTHEGKRHEKQGKGIKQAEDNREREEKKQQGTTGKKKMSGDIRNSRRKKVPLTDREKEILLGRAFLAYQESKQSIKSKDSTIKSAAQAGGRAALDQMEGGNEVRDAAYTARTLAKPVTGTASKGAELFKKQQLARLRARIKKREVEQQTAKKAAKDTAKKAAGQAAKETAKFAAREGVKMTVKTGVTAAGTVAGAETGALSVVIGMAAGGIVGDIMDRADMKRNARNRKIKFFLDKMKAAEEQKDSGLKFLFDLFMNRISLPVKKLVSLAGTLLVFLMLLIVLAAIPVVSEVAILYNSPFALFLPPLADGDGVQAVAGSYVTAFTQTVGSMAADHTGYDGGHLVYVDYEGEGTPSNLNDIIAVYMVRYGVGDTAVVMNELTKRRLKAVVEDMCTYTTRVETDSGIGADGMPYVDRILYVEVTLKSAYDMAEAYRMNEYQKELMEEVLYTLNAQSGQTMQEALTQEEMEEILGDFADTDGAAGTAVLFALSKVGYPYSQQYRDSGAYFDCSSLVYYAWQAAGTDISFSGANTAAAEAQGLDAAGKCVDLSEIQAGDLIFYSYEKNGRFLDISHVALYVGNGMVVEAKGAAYGVTCNAVPNADKIVMVGRPYEEENADEHN